MNAPECLQLILEPESRLYNHPVLVLDFQSLYPSIMIAYNYWFVLLSFFFFSIFLISPF